MEISPREVGRFARQRGMIDLHDVSAVERLRRELRVDPHRIKRTRVAFYKNHRGAEAALAEIPDAARATVRDRVRFHHLELAERRDSAVDGASKLLFRTEDDLTIETVILRVRTGRTALCVSTQVGCAADCSFCATGKLGLTRNLTTGEVLDQIVRANALLADEGRRVRNIVFMGMGEPFHNEKALHGALAALVHPDCFHHAPRQIAVSTVGIPASMIRCARRFPGVRIALSLHSARDAVRRELIPLARRHPLAELRSAVADVAAIQQQPVMLEYLMLEGYNDADADLDALAAWSRDLDVHINLIPYNPIDGAPSLRGTPQPRREAFASELKARGFTVTLRYSLGADVDAACGQLVRGRNRRLSAPEA